jgi:hypothetical protein
MKKNMRYFISKLHKSNHPFLEKQRPFVLSLFFRRLYIPCYFSYVLPVHIRANANDDPLNVVGNFSCRLL